ncbi:SMI1/KNR4 family protein [Paenibacillus sp. FSL M7-1046]|uniref:SMI1/KNR4 family protein n=1 Tax=Paenibacillus sp. FSL M7-1046 TaxID=2975315 RepID=UPI0030FC988C
MSENLLEQLELWHEEDEIQEIVDAIEEIDPEERDYVLNSHLGRALNNLGRYEEALELFEEIAEEGEEDPLWHFRVGFCHYYLKQYDEAIREFEIADKLDPEDEDTLEFLTLSRRKAAKKKSTVKKPVQKFDFSNFWDDSEYALDTYVSEPPSDELIASVEEELVFKLPAFYTSMMKLHNGGIPHNTRVPLGQEDLEISGFLGIGRDKSQSLCGAAGSRARIEEGGYPEIGVVICDTPAAEHEVVMLDYRSSGNDGEPEVVHVDKDNNYKITKLANNFEVFIRGLVSAEN